MPRDFELGKWIKGKHKSQRAFAGKLGVDPTRLSRWLNLSDGISDDYQAKIRKLGYTGPWPAEEEQDTAAGGPAPYVTREESARDYGRLEGRIERLEAAFEKLGEAVRLLLQEREEARQAGRR